MINLKNLFNDKFNILNTIFRASIGIILIIAVIISMYCFIPNFFFNNNEGGVSIPDIVVIMFILIFLLGIIIIFSIEKKNNKFKIYKK